MILKMVGQVSIGAFAHKLLIKKINAKSAIINLGGSGKFFSNI